MPETPGRVPLPGGGAALRGTLSPLAARACGRSPRPYYAYCPRLARLSRLPATSQESQDA